MKRINCQTFTLLLALIAAVFTPAATTLAKNIDLSTVPDRQTVQLTIYNAEDLTLVRETRVITFKQGINPLQFSWANTLIDPTSVELRFKTQPAQFTLLDTTFPHDRPQVLYWNIQSEMAGEATVEISYFTSGITWAADYTAIASPSEDQLRLESFVTVTNNSGEDYENAQVRLVVGKINLVEKIAQLAQQGMAGHQPEGQLGQARRNELRQRAVREMMFKADMAAAPSASMELDEAKQIVKEGLSEYFIFTIEGTETVPNRWAKRLRSFDAGEVPVKIQYRYRANEYGDQLVRMYLLTNDEEAGLGESPLPDGIVRVFRQKDADSLAYVTTQQIKYIPVGDKIELNLGVDREVVFELEMLAASRDEIWAKLHGADVLKRLDQPGLRIDPRSDVVGWNTHMRMNQKVRNYTSKPIEIEVRRQMQGDMTFRSNLAATRHDNNTVQYIATIKPGETANLEYELIQKEGRNQQQNRVEIEQGNPRG